MANTKTLRNNARNKLPRVHERANGKCHYCQCDTVIVRKIPEADRVVVKTYTVEYLIDGVFTEAAIASVDHVCEIRNGGTSRMSNLVLACVRCNAQRDRAFYKSMNKEQRRRFALSRHKKNGTAQTASYTQWASRTAA